MIDIVFASLFDVPAFTSTGDAANGMVFGRDLGTWLVYALIFFVVSLCGFVWVWGMEFIADRRQGKPLEKPWD